jgi:hypothetical protein
MQEIEAGDECQRDRKRGRQEIPHPHAQSIAPTTFAPDCANRRVRCVQSSRA